MDLWEDYTRTIGSCTWSAATRKETMHGEGGLSIVSYGNLNRKFQYKRQPVGQAKMSFICQSTVHKTRVRD